MSTRVAVIFEVYDEYADPNHPSGLSEEGDMALSRHGIGDIVDVVKVDDDCDRVKDIVL